MKLFLTTCLLIIFASSFKSAQPKNHPHSLLTRAQIREAEQRLADIGYWTGVVDGRFDTATGWALIAFQKYEGRTITGKLTIDELEAIRTSDAPRPRDSGYAHVEVDLDRQVLLIVGELTESADKSAHSKDSRVRVLPVSTGNDKKFMSDGVESIAYTPRGRFAVYDKSFGWENGQLGSVYYANYISGGVAIHGYLSVPNEPASHGCIRIPMFAARQVSRQLQLGTIVLVYDSVSFVSAKEWAENPKLKEAAMLNGAEPDYVDNKKSLRKTRTRTTRT
ncbi:MAG TPA: L,D-transpeptidase family protein [Pyrinomonadaceae bacterium]|nr:L,D-transpeptidase family protein [Pyrinomonadaceae bacterium]